MRGVAGRDRKLPDTLRATGWDDPSVEDHDQLRKEVEEV